ASSSKKKGWINMLRSKFVGQIRFAPPLIPKLLTILIGIATLCGPMPAVERRHSVLTGTVTDVGSAVKTVVVKTADGAEHTFVFAEHTTVHGAKDVGKGSADTFRGLEKGSKVVVHYTAEGGKETADELDKVGDDGLKAVKGTVTHVRRGGKFITVETADGAKES